ncbi:MAG: amino acid ABC transporter permease [Desulfovibrio sp.]|jgi:polar amino acid transport system permease protein|nr:amino acid ABC transporter permease [Desulfovibrio sp.]
MQSLTVVINALPSMLAGSFVTVGNVAVSLALGLCLGIPLAVGQVYGKAGLRCFAGLFVWFFRGVPILVLLFLFYGLFIALGLPVEPFFICCLVLGLTSAAYQSQIFRGAMQSLPKGQLSAARALGMRDRTAITGIVLPQALRLSIPGFANEFSILLKDSAICFVLGTQDIMARTSFAAAHTHEHLALYLVTCMELMGEGKVVASDTFRFMEVFLAVGAYYLALVTVAGFLLRRLERRFHVPGFGAR